MRDINYYVEAAIARGNIKSQRKLSEMLGLSNNVISVYLTGKSIPSDETMMKLAAIAGIDPWVALLDLNMWRSQGAAQDAYRDMMKKITAVAIAGILIAVGVAPAPAHAKVNYNCDTNPSVLYIMEI